MADEPTVTEEAVKDNEVTQPDEVEQTDDYADLESIEVSDTELEDTDEESNDEQSEDEESPEEVEEESEPAVTEEDKPEPSVDQSKSEDTADEEPQEEESVDVARKAFEERQQKRQEDEKKFHDQKLETQNKYLNEAENDTDLAVRQLQIDAYTNRVDGNRSKLETGIDRAVADIKLFREGTPEQQEELIRRLDDFEEMFVRKDANGDPIEIAGDVYQYLQKEATAIEKLSRVGEVKGKKSAAQTKARTFVPPSSKPVEKKSDPDLDDFDSEIARIG